MRNHVVTLSALVAAFASFAAPFTEGGVTYTPNDEVARRQPVVTGVNVTGMVESVSYTKGEVDRRIETNAPVRSVNGMRGNVKLGAREVGALPDNRAYLEDDANFVEAVRNVQIKGGRGWGAVDSVNGKTGDVILVSSDVGAVANDSAYEQVASKAGSALQWSDISPSQAKFSEAVLGVGLNIDTNSVAVLNEIASSFGGFPITGTATTIGGLLAALAAAVAWLRKRSVVTIGLSDPNETMVQVKGRLDGLQNGHVLFDTSSLDLENKMYLCGIDIDSSSGFVRVQDMRTGRIYIGSYVGSETILQVLSRSVNEYVPITVTATRRDGSPVTGKYVYLYDGSDETGRLIESVVYNGEPITFKVGGGFRYFVKMETIDGLFVPTTASGVANSAVSVSIVYGDADHIYTYDDVKMALDALGTVEAAKAKLAGKVVIADTWTDLDSIGDGDNDTSLYPEHPLHDADGHPIWDDPMVCTNVEMVTDSDGNQHLGAIFMRMYATAKKIQFDAPNQEEATEETAEAGITYYGMAIGQTTPSTSNLTVLSLSEGDAIPYSSYAKVYKNAYNDSSKNVLVNGHNRYETSAYRQYLCADKSVAAGGWWRKMHVGQVFPTDGDFTSHPYQAGCSDALLAAIKPVKRTVASNTKCDGGVDYEICDPFWLPAVREMYGTTSMQEGSEQREYWQSLIKDESVEPNNNTSKVNAVRKQYQVTDKGGSALLVRLRSAYVTYSNNAYYVHTSGYVYNNTHAARTPYASLPACAIY